MSNWNKLASKESLEKTIKNVEERGIKVEVVKDKAAALKKLKELIPAGSELMTGTSTTLNQIGFMEYLESPENRYNFLSNKIWAENDEAKRGTLRRKSTTSEYFVSSINAISENGELVAVDNTGSRVGAIPFAAENVILIAGTNKITPDLDSAMKRIREYVYPLEVERAKKAYGIHSNMSKWIIIEKEVNPNRIKLILIEEELGF